MKNATTTTCCLTIGIDLGDRHSHLCVLDEAGSVIEEGRLPTTPEAFQRRFGEVPAARVALEVGTHSPWVSSFLKEAGHEVLVANSRKLRMIFKSDSKNDRFDAEQLARVAPMDPRLLSPIEHRGRDTRVDLAVLRSRDCLVATRTRLVNHVRGCLKSFGIRPKKCSTASFDAKVVDCIPEELRAALLPVVRSIAETTATIRAYDKQIAKLAQEKYPETVLLMEGCPKGRARRPRRSQGGG